MLGKTRRILTAVSLAGALSLGLAATASAAFGDTGERGPRMTLTDQREGLQSWLQALLSRLVKVWAADGAGQVGTGTPTH